LNFVALTVTKLTTAEAAAFSQHPMHCKTAHHQRLSNGFGHFPS
jgi:hypothetical protein